MTGRRKVATQHDEKQFVAEYEINMWVFSEPLHRLKLSHDPKFNPSSWRLCLDGGIPWFDSRLVAPDVKEWWLWQEILRDKFDEDRYTDVVVGYAESMTWVIDPKWRVVYAESLEKERITRERLNRNSALEVCGWNMQVLDRF